MKMYNIKSIITVMIIVISIAFTGCQKSSIDPDYTSNKYTAKESFQFSEQINNQNNFILMGINGSIDIIGKENLNTIEIWGEKIVKSYSEENAEFNLDKLDIDIYSSNNEVIVKTIQPKDEENIDFEVVYHILIPKHFKIDANNINGNILIDSIKNNISVMLTNGNTTIKEIEGNTKVNVVNGQIEGKVLLPDFGSSFLSTVNGNINMDIPNETSANFTANITNGTINVSNLNLTNTQITKKTTRGTLGTGNGTIQLTTINGAIVINE